MSENEYLVKIPRVGLFNISIIVIVASIVLSFPLYTLLFDRYISFGGMFVISFVIFGGWIFPIFLYLKQPQKIIFSDKKLTVINRINKEQIILKKNIHKIVEVKDLIDKKKIFDLYFDNNKPQYRINFDEDSGKHLWDWYHNEGDWKKEEVK